MRNIYQNIATFRWLATSEKNTEFPWQRQLSLRHFFESKRGRLNHYEKESAVEIPNVFHRKKQSKIPPHFYPIALK